MISSYDQPSNTEQIVRSRTRRRRAARPMTICVPGGIWVYDFIGYSLRFAQEIGEGTQKAQKQPQKAQKNAFLYFLCSPLCLLWFVPLLLGKAYSLRSS